MRLKTFVSALLTAFLILALISPVIAEDSTVEPSVWTDELDYAPGETALILGSGFTPNTQLTINITRPDTLVNITYAQSNEAGNFSCYYGPVWLMGEYNVIATDGVNVAETTFFDCWVIIRMYYSEDHKPFSDEVDWRGFDYVFNPGKYAYISFYQLKLNTNYRVQLLDWKNNVVKAYEFNSDGSTSRDDKVLIPSDALLSVDGKTWKIKICEKVNSGWYLQSCIAFWVAKIQTYEDPNYLNPRDHFLPAETMYIKGEGFKPYKCIRISYYYDGDSDPVKIDGPYCVWTNSHGTFKTKYTCEGPAGEWIILARWSEWCWCPSKHYKTEIFFVIPEIPLGTVSVFLITLLSLFSYKRISIKKESL